MFEAIAEGLALNGITALASVVQKRLKRSSSVRRTVRRHFGEEVEPDTQLERIGVEIQTALAREALLDTTSDKILRKVAASSLIRHIVDCIDVDVVPRHSLRLIEALAITAGGFNADRAKNFAEALVQTISELARMESDALPIYTKSEMRSREKVVRRREAAILSSLTKYEKAGSSEFEDLWELNSLKFDTDEESRIFSALAENIKNANDDVDVHSADGNIRKVSLEDIYVEPNIYSIPAAQYVSYYRDMQLTHFYGLHASWSSFVEGLDRAVLLGDPGGGKSTFSKKLCTELALAVPSGSNVLPIFIKLRSYIAVQASDKSVKLYQYVLNEICDLAPDVDREKLNSLLSYWLATGSIVLFLDGLDEVLTVSNRNSMAEEIIGLSERYLLSRFLVTSRFVGYESAPLSDFRHYGVGDLTPDAISQLFEKIFVTVMEQPQELVEVKRFEFMSEAREKASELITNPLLLTLIIIVHSRRRQIPDNRADLYGFCAELLFDRWDSYRDIKPNLPERYRLSDLLMHLSHILLDTEEYGGNISKDKLILEAKKFFRLDYVDNREGRAAEAAHLMVDHLVGRSWILHEVGENTFEFTHRTFLEFFYAKYLDSNYESTEELMSSIRDWVRSGAKSVSCHLVLQMRCKDKRPAAGKIALSIKKIVEDDFSYGALRFAIATFDYLLPDATILEHYCRCIVRFCISTSDVDGLIKLSMCKSAQSEIVKNVILDELAATKGIVVLRKLGKFWSFLIANSRENFSRAAWRGFIEKFVPNIKPLERRSPFVAKLLFDLTGDANWTVIKIHASSIWSASRTDLLSNDPKFDQFEQMFRAVASPRPTKKMKQYLLLAENSLDWRFEGRDPVPMVRGGRIKFKIGMPGRGFEKDKAPLAMAILLAVAEIQISQGNLADARRIAIAINKLSMMWDVGEKIKADWEEGSISIFTQKSKIVSRATYLNDKDIGRYADLPF